jgi:PAS domain S-box-containing protein
MSEPYKILIIEDGSQNAAIEEYIAGYCNSHMGELKRVDTEVGFVDALDTVEWDIVLSDYKLNDFSAEAALKIINRRGLDIPLIVISRKEDEHDIMAVLYAGAEHFITKDDMEHLCITVPRSIANARRRREITSELQKYRKHLEELVAARTAELESANEQLQDEVGKRKRMEDALRESESQYRNLVENAHDGICIVQDKKLQFTNHHLVHMLGCNFNSVIGTDFIDYCFPDECERINELYRRIIKGEDDMQRFDTALVTNRGQRMEVSISSSAIDYHGRRAVMSVVRDITEQKRISRMALENEKLEAVGVVARGVGSNFSNIISVISSYAVSITDSFLPHTRPHDSARKILDATRHASVLTKRLLSVVQVSETDSEKIRLEPVLLTDVLKKATDLVAHSLQANGIRLMIKKRTAMPYVMADSNQLLDTLISIFMNAIDAMPDGGTLAINMLERHIAKPRSNPNSPGGRFVGLSIHDNGIGMEKSQLSKVFEPFFTTKGAQDAFGLGLPVAQSMAQSWGGWIDIRSRQGKGTRVRVFMVKTDVSSGSLPDNSASPMKILVVDDNDGRREMMVSTLLGKGHQVIEASDGDMAIELHRQHASDIDLYVVDWLLPGTDGKDVLKAILEHNSEAKVVMISGFSRDYVRSEIRMGAWGFLQKPFSAEELTRAVDAECRRKTT